MEEDRQDPRLEERNIVNLTVISAPDGHDDVEGSTVFSFTEDYSMKGLSFPASTELPVDTIVKVSVSFQSPTETVRDITGHVAWIRHVEDDKPYRIGLDFCFAPEAELASWKKAVKQRLG